MSPMSPRLLRPRAASGFDPRSIAGLELWLDATADTTLTRDGTAVTAWASRSGSLSVTQSDTTKAPTYASSVAGLNSKPALLFDGSNDILLNTATGILAAGEPAMTLFVAHQPSTIGNNCVFDIAQGASYAGTGTIRRLLSSANYSQAGRAYFAFGTRDFHYNNSETLANVAAIHGIVVAAGDVSSAVPNPVYYKNGTSSAPANTVATGDVTFTPSRFSVGSSSQGASEFYAGHIAEVLLYSTALSAADRQRVEGYLAWKFGLQSTLPYNHPYAASFPGYGSQTVPTDSDALTYLAAVATADGGTGVEVGVANAVDDFVKGCKADGIWSAIKASCILSGARTLSGALVPLVGTAPTNVNFVSGDYNRKTGLQGNGSNKYLDSNRAGNADGQNDSHIAAYISTDSNQAGGTFPFYVGLGQGETGSTHIGRTSTTGVRFLRSRCSTESTISGATTGLFGISRSASSSFIGRAMGTNTTFNVTSQTPMSLNHFVFAGNQLTGANYFSNARLAFYSIGSALTLATLDSRVSALYTAIGAAIP